MKKKWVIKDKVWFNNSLNCTAVKLLQNLVDLSMNDFNSIYKKSISLVFILFCFNAANAQTNLVPNPSFEQYTTCPISNRNDKPDYWYKPDYRGAAYFNACANVSAPNNGVPAHLTVSGNGFQYARTGVAYILMFYRNGGDSRNYFQVKLLDSLQLGKCYYAECYVSLSNPFRLGCNNQSILFTKTAVYVDTLNTQLLPANPQITNYGNPIITDTLNWTKISGVFIAQGGEQYLTLGNFRDNSNTAYSIIQPTGYFGADYYVDDVAVYALDSFNLKADAGKDTSIANVGDSVFIGSLTNGITNITWYNSSGTIINTQAPGFFIKPIVSTFYVVEQTVCGYTSRDTVNVTVGIVPLKFISYNLLSSLRGTKQSVSNIWTTANEINVSHFNVLKSIDGVNFKTIGKSKAQNKLTNEYSFTDETPNEGLNYYKIESVDFDGRKQYSTTQQINTKPQTPNIAVFPNPAKDYLNISSQENIKEIKIINQIGQVLEYQTPNSKQITINTKQLIKGVYIVQCITNKGEISTQKLLIQ